MRPVSLNLASRPFRNNALMGSLLGIVGAALVLASGYNLYVFLSYGSSYAALQREQAEDKVKIAALQVEERRLVEEIRQRNFRQVFEQGKIAGELILRGAFSWTQLFNTLEALVPPDVVMTAIRPNITSEGIVMRIEGVAKNHGALLTFETRLQQSTSFAKVFPASERRLNPNLPDISFLLTCDYLPQGKVSPDQVAAAATGDAAAGKAAEAPAGGSATAPQVERAPSAPSAPTEKPALRTAGVVVGREGEPRDRRTSGSPVLAPGAVYVPAGDVVPASNPARRTSASRAGATQGKTASVQTKPAEASPPGPPKKTAKPVVSKPAAEGGTQVAQKTEAAQKPPVRAPAGPRGYDPNVLHTMPPEKRAAIEARAKAEKKPVAAVRLDVPLTFVSRPVEEVYQRLSEAHGVRFDLDPGVDRNATVTINLRGRKLDDAILMISGAARHKVKRLADGVYQVTTDAGGRAIGENPVAEEPLQEEKP